MHPIHAPENDHFPIISFGSLISWNVTLNSNAFSPPRAETKHNRQAMSNGRMGGVILFFDWPNDRCAPTGAVERMLK